MLSMRTSTLYAPYYFVSYGDVATIYSFSSTRSVDSFAAKGADVQVLTSLREGMNVYRRFCHNHHPHEDHQSDYEYTRSVAEVVRHLPYIVSSESEPEVEAEGEVEAYDGGDSNAEGDSSELSEDEERFLTPASSGYESSHGEEPTVDASPHQSNASLISDDDSNGNEEAVDTSRHVSFAIPNTHVTDESDDVSSNCPDVIRLRGAATWDHGHLPKYYLVRIDRFRSILFSDRAMAFYYFTVCIEKDGRGDFIQSDGVLDSPDTLVREHPDTQYAYGVRQLPTGTTHVYADRRLAQALFEQIIEEGGKASMCISTSRFLALGWVVSRYAMMGYDFEV
ncbi:hypothetical protein ONZ45_g12163 [Pleurotus djamor]|nr:hypothetical protein ONZ45_g12163 [Pleurotus djamor]